MLMHRPPRSSPTQAQRASLLRFEELYEEWRVAWMNRVRSEQELVAASLAADDVPSELAERAARLRAIEGDARRKALAARDETDE